MAERLPQRRIEQAVHRSPYQRAKRPREPAGEHLAGCDGDVLIRLREAEMVRFVGHAEVLELGDVVPIGGAPPEAVLTTAAAAEQGSEHPLARVILAAASDRALSLSFARMKASIGFAVRATVFGSAGRTTGLRAHQFRCFSATAVFALSGHTAPRAIHVCMRLCAR